MIAAVGKNLELGYHGDLVWQLHDDMKFFRDTTLGHTVVMGGRTWASLPHGALKERQNLVLSRTLSAAEGAQVFADRAALDQYLATCDDQIFIIGGASLYSTYLPVAERLYLTEIDDQRPADVYFPQFNHADFKRTILKSGSENGIKYQMVLYERQ